MQPKSIATIDDLVELLIPSWRAALGVEVTADSDFLALGGTSLAAIAIADAVAKRYGTSKDLEIVTLESTFEAPTLHAMASILTAYINEHTAAQPQSS